ncbi:MAG: hypothetical protein ACTSVY_16035 [Candidatus Helarchaeota archaeon]
MEPIIINPKEILQIINKKYGIQIDSPILDFQFDPSTHLFGIRFFKSKSVISDSVDEEGQIILNRDEKTDKISSLEILDINFFLANN